jgi:hypothetical protein
MITLYNILTSFNHYVSYQSNFPYDATRTSIGVFLRMKSGQLSILVKSLWKNIELSNLWQWYLCIGESFKDLATLVIAKRVCYPFES